MPGFHLVWQKDELLLRGYDFVASDWKDGQLTFPVAYPGRYSDTKIITLRSSARDQGTLDVLKTVKLYLVGDATDLYQVMEVWPFLSDTKPELNGGFEISFDEGRSYTRLQYVSGGSSNAGYKGDASTWITLPAEAIGLNGIAGELGPFDRAKLYVRFKIPPQATNYKLLNVQLAADFDVI
jgi:hypothetical protein